MNRNGRVQGRGHVSGESHTVRGRLTVEGEVVDVPKGRVTWTERGRTDGLGPLPTSTSQNTPHGPSPEEPPPFDYRRGGSGRGRRLE